jgi:hypothetical protein
MNRIIDTNVAITANGRDTHASDECQLECINALIDIVNKCTVYLDDQNLIFEEYRKNLKFVGSPGTGDMFFKHIFDNLGNQTKCRIVSITPENSSFAEFPDDINLKNFDIDDHKFVAVAIASGDNPSIVNAVDSDWKNHKEALQSHGIKVIQLCKHG